MTVDWDGKIRMDCSSPYAMARLIGMRDKFDVAFANDTDADRHGIVTRSNGLMNPNHFLAAGIAYLFAHRPQWRTGSAVGKTIVSSAIIDRVAKKLGRALVETPVGFKWFVDGLSGGSFGFAGEESAGASFLRRDGSAWTTDKDGIILGLLAAEMTARTGRDPSQLFDDLTRELGVPFYERIDAPATPAQKNLLKALSPEKLAMKELAGEPVRAALTAAPGNGQPFGGIKVSTDNGWFAARPSGTEDVYKIYAESFRSEEHLRQIQSEAQAAIARAFVEVCPVLRVVPAQRGPHLEACCLQDCLPLRLIGRAPGVPACAGGMKNATSGTRDWSPLSRRPAAQMRPDHLHHFLRRGAGRKEAEIVAVAVHQVDERRMIDRVIAVALVEIDALVIDPVGVGGVRDRLGAAGQSDQARMKHRHIVRKMLPRVAFGIEGDEQRLHVAGAGAQFVHRQTDGLQVGRANVGAIGEAEIHQHQVTAKVALAAQFPGLVGELERAADRLPIPHHRIHQFGGGPF